MNVIVIGSGGREHAIALKIKESPLLKNLYIAPGNPGTLEIGENIDLDGSDHEALLSFIKDKGIDLVVVGPEQPLVEGIADRLRKENILVFGPDKKAALIEGDKAFAKSLMKKYHIPTADYATFSEKDFDQAVAYLKKASYPLVVKASGLAAGKGVLICHSEKDAISALKDCFLHKVFGKAGSIVVFEEFLHGEEASLFAITDGNTYLSLPFAQDHKRIFDNDEGKNTGGMGAYAPTPLIDSTLKKTIEETIITPMIDAMRKEGFPFNGCLYCGLMITPEGPKVVEFNCRFGDPETQVVLPLLSGDFLKLLYSTAKGAIDQTAVTYSGGSAICVIAASKGYPGSYEKGYEIKGLSAIKAMKENIVYHAGTKIVDDKIVTSGGRVLGVTAVLDSMDLKSCKKIAYNAIRKLAFEGIHYRNDISDKALK